MIACVNCKTPNNSLEMFKNETGHLVCWACHETMPGVVDEIARGVVDVKALLAFLARHHDRLDDCHRDIVPCEMCDWIQRLCIAALEAR